MAKIYISLSFVLSIIISSYVVVHSATEMPSIFIFGDSTADVGTNTLIPESSARADFPHNGIDFPRSRSTGRFSNGFNSADYVAKLLGHKRSPAPYLHLLTLKSPFCKHLFRGVNFASGGAGLLDVTGAEMNVVPLSEQIRQFSNVKGNLIALIGRDAAESTVSKSLFFVSIGSNDIFGYFENQSSIPSDRFIGMLTSAYADHITNLYKLGARKIGIVSVASIGCCPSQRLIQKLVNAADGCFEPENQLAIAFHSALARLLQNISSKLAGFKYSLGDGYKMTIDVINNPSAFGFDDVESACCGTGMLNAQGTCNSTASLCPDRRKYLFWDLYHPTKKAANLAAQTLYYGSTRYVSPINFSQLAMEA